MFGKTLDIASDQLTVQRCFDRLCARPATAKAMREETALHLAEQRRA